MPNEPDNIIDLQPYLDAAKAQEHREQMVNAIIASAKHLDEPKQCDHGVSFDQVCGQCYARTHSDPFQFTPPRKG